MTQASSADQPFPNSGFDDMLDRFEQEWRSGAVPSIEQFLGALAVSTRRKLVVELVKIDLGHRWRNARPGAPQAWDRPRLEDYSQRHSDLGPPERLPVDLIGEEYWVRQRWGDRPAHAEYLQRFPQTVTQLRDVLSRLDRTLAVEFRSGARPSLMVPAAPTAV